jgi:hypothetical protein
VNVVEVLLGMLEEAELEALLVTDGPDGIDEAPGAVDFFGLTLFLAVSWAICPPQVCSL